MRLNALPLYNYLLNEKISGNSQPLIIFVNQVAPAGVTKLPGIVAGYRRSPEVDAESVLVSSDWWRPDFWTTVFAKHGSDLRSGSAVFATSLDEIPAVAFNKLHSIGVREILFNSFGQWRVLPLSNMTLLRLRLLGRTIRRKWHATSEPARLRVLATLRKLALKLFSHPLNDAPQEPFKNFSGNAYRVMVPKYKSIGDTAGLEQSSLWLFEEKLRLIGHRPHHEVQRIGLGKFSHWEGEVHFSTSDNSNPNENGRRYRFIIMKGAAKLLAPLLRAPTLEATGAANSSPSSSWWSPQLREQPFGQVLGNTLPSPSDESLAHYLDQNIESDWPRGFAQQGLTTVDEINLLIGSLASGGAERQICYLARGLKRAGHNVRVLIPEQHNQGGLHYYPLLKQNNIPIKFISAFNDKFSLTSMINPAGLKDLSRLEGLPPEFSHDVYSLYSHLMETRPSILHCSLDYMNIVGAVAGWLAGVPRIVVSARSVNPTHFPPLYRDWFQPWYKLMVRSPRVHFTANSRAGAESYAEWLSISPEAIQVVHNGIESSIVSPPTAEQIKEFRRSIAAADDAPIISGVLRFTGEKRPLRFIRIISELRKRLPNVKAVIAGDGPLLAMSVREIDNLELKGVIHLLGRRDDIPTVIGASRALLMTSQVEGLPNVLMEAQLLGIPGVAPRVGGIPEVMQNNIGGFIFDPEKVSEAVDALYTILTDQALARELGERGKQSILEDFSIEAMVNGFTKSYGLTSSSDRWSASKVANGA